MDGACPALRDVEARCGDVTLVWTVSARAHWWYYGHFIASVDCHARITLVGFFFHAYVVKIDRHSAAFQDFVRDARVFLLHSSEQTGDGHRGREEIVFSTSVRSCGRKVEEREVSSRRLWRGHLRQSMHVSLIIER